MCVEHAEQIQNSNHSNWPYYIVLNLKLLQNILLVFIKIL